MRFDLSETEEQIPAAAGYWRCRMTTELKQQARIFETCNFCKNPIAHCICKQPDEWRDALRHYMDYRTQAVALECEEPDCTCDPDNFHTCDLCREAGEKSSAMRRLMDLWGDEWAVRLQRGMLPFQQWCDCGHISGQHALDYPHVCTVAGGCEKECYGFRSRLIAAAPELLKRLQELVKVIRDGQCGDFSPIMDEIFDAEHAISQATGGAA